MDEQAIDTRRSTRLSRRDSAAWGGGFLLGVLWTIVGVLCIGATAFASLAAVFYVGALLAVAGLLGIAFGFRGAGPSVALLGVLSLVVGVLLFIHPGEGMAALTLLVIAYFLVAGVSRIITSLADRYDGWGWDFAYGAGAIAIALIAVRAWPLSTFWLLGILLGTELIARGVAMMAGAVTARQVLHTLRERDAST